MSKAKEGKVRRDTKKEATKSLKEKRASKAARRKEKNEASKI